MKKLETGLLNAYYGGLLNSHQTEIMRLYYDCDMSLSEIAEQLDITRQGVREVLVRSGKKLEGYEQKLGLVKKVKNLATELEKIIQRTENSQTIKTDLQQLLISIKEL